MQCNNLIICTIYFLFRNLDDANTIKSLESAGPDDENDHGSKLNKECKECKEEIRPDIIKGKYVNMINSNCHMQ